MAVFTEILSDDDQEAGVHRTEFSNAVSVWISMQDGTELLTVASVALAFNTTPDLVRQAVEDNYWMSLDNPTEADPAKQRIWQEGE